MMEELEISRREILAGLATAGGSGVAAGTGTAAVFSDEELFQGSIRAGTVDLVVETDAGTSDGGGVSVPIAATAESRTGATTLRPRLPDADGNNPVYLWLRSSCPEPPTELAEALQIALSYDCSPGDVLFSGSLRAFAEWAVGGRPLSPACEDRATGEQGCLQRGGSVPLRLDWELDEDYAGTGSARLDLEFLAVQCRGTDGANPFPAPPEPDCEPPTDRYGLSYVEVWACEGRGDCDCSRIGKLELEDDYCGAPGVAENHVEPGRRYPLYEDGDDCVDTGYELLVTDATVTSDGDGAETTGVAFELLAAGEDDGPDLCRVDLKGGPETVTYEGPSAFEGNATDGQLHAPEREP